MAHSWATGTERAVKPRTQNPDLLHTRNTLLKQVSPDRRARRIRWCAQLRAPHGRCAQSGAPSSATRTAVNDNRYMTLNCRLKPVRILRLCAPSNTVCTAARTGRPDICRRGPRAYRALTRRLRLLFNVRLIRTMSAAADRARARGGAAGGLLRAASLMYFKI